MDKCPAGHPANGQPRDCHPDQQHGVCTTTGCAYNEHNSGGTYDAKTNTMTHPDGTVTSNYK